jgi:hypothetical protein
MKIGLLYTLQAQKDHKVKMTVTKCVLKKEQAFDFIHKLKEITMPHK